MQNITFRTQEPAKKSIIPSNQQSLHGPQLRQDHCLKPIQLYHGLHLHTKQKTRQLMKSRGWGYISIKPKEHKYYALESTRI